MKRGRGQYEGQEPPQKKPNTGGAPAPGHMPKVQDALGYLEKVKQKFSSQPAVYNQFLEIMKDFKSQAIDTEGVIRRVKTLFKGNKQLILGFNQFLPPGYKIELDPEPAARPVPAAKPNIEFNHAVQYVGKIKARFRDQPDIYGEFLDILHDYQAKRTIDEVYQRVQKLFAGQPDLLDEFKYFLPDNQAPAGATPTKRPPPNANKKKPAAAGGAAAGGGAAGAPGAQQRPGRKDKDPRDKKPGGGGGAVGTSSSSSAAGGKSDKQAKVRTVSYPQGSEKDIQLMDKIKQAVSKPQWIQVVKVLNLFSVDIITRPEMIRMLEDIVGEKHADMIEKFKTNIGYDEWEERQMLYQQKNNYYAFMSSADLSQCDQVTPSYRLLPRDIHPPPCSGRTPLSEEVLNDTVISIPTGSEDFSFKATRKNIYEENLFKCEDERFELDMVVENNASTIRVLEPFVSKINVLTGEQASRLKLGDALDTLHIRSIIRLYGESGYDVVELLKRSPATAIPVILMRLKQKDEEWRRVRVEMKNQWRKVNEQNYSRSLDHRSFYFKQEDKKRRAPKALIANLRDTHLEVFEGAVLDSKELRGGAVAHNVLMGAEAGTLYNYCMNFKLNDVAIHHQIAFIIDKVTAKALPEPERVKLLAFWQAFIHHFYAVPAAPGSPTPPPALSAELATLFQSVGGFGSMTTATAALSAAAAGSKTVAGKDDSDIDEDLTKDKPAAMADGEAPAPAASAAAAPAAAAAAPAAAATAAAVSSAGAAADEKKDPKKKKSGGKGGRKQSAKTARGKGKPSASADDMTDDDPKAAADEEDADADASTDADSAASKLPTMTGAPAGSRPGRKPAAATAAAAGGAAKGGAGRKRKGGKPEASDDAATAPSTVAATPAASVTIGSASGAASAIAGSAPGRLLSGHGGVKPTRVQLESTWALEEKLNPIRRHERPSRLFFANSVYYVLLRLHQFLYHRLLTAKQLSYKARAPTAATKNKIPADPEARYQLFTSKLFELLEKGTENSRFEDELRALMGASSFVLFSIDKLVAQLVKQTQSIVNSTSHLQLLRLYHYEHARSRGDMLLNSLTGAGPVTLTPPPISLERSAHLARMYQLHAAAFISDAETCAQIEYFEDSQHMGIGLVESLSAASIETQHKADDPHWNAYMERYFQPSPASIARKSAPHQRPFLDRGIRSVLSAYPTMEAVMADVEFKNLLGSKICMEKYDSWYIEETEDIFIRHRSQRLSRAALARHNVSAPLPAKASASATDAHAKGRAAARAEVAAANTTSRAAAKAAIAEKASKWQNWVNARFTALFPDGPTYVDLSADPEPPQPPSPPPAAAAAAAAVAAPNEADAAARVQAMMAATGQAMAVDKQFAAEQEQQQLRQQTDAATDAAATAAAAQNEMVEHAPNMPSQQLPLPALPPLPPPQP